MAADETRKLVAVMFSDITGYTAMIQENETSALAMVDVHRSVLKQYTEEYNGEIIAFYGDGSLSTYPSAIDSVRCAIDMQRAYSENTVPVRIGIHFGDVVFKEGTVFGDGVNLASRIETQGIPGSILISAKLQEEIVHNPDIKTKSLGYYTLKNISSKIELFAVVNDGLRLPAGKGKFGRSWQKVVSTLVVLTFIFLLGYIANDFNHAKSNTELKQAIIAVRFIDFTNLESTDQLADMASHWIGNRLEDIPGSHVVKYENTNYESNILLATAGSAKRHDFAFQTGAANLLEGQIFNDGDSIVYDAKIIDLASARVIQKFGPTRCAIADPMAGIDAITGEIQGWWASKEMKVISVPNYKAYQAYLKARSVWLNDEVLAEKKLKEAIAADPSFIDPYFLLLGYLQNNDLYPERDTLLAEIRERFDHMNSRQSNNLAIASLDAAGDLTGTYKKYLNELKVDSLDFFTNTEAMVMAMFYINDPLEVIRIYEMIPVDNVEFADCGYCKTRWRTAILAYLALDSVDRASETIDLIDNTSRRNLVRKIQVFSLNDDSTAIKRIIDQALRDKIERANSLWEVAARQYMLHGNQSGLEMTLRNALHNLDNHDAYSLAEVFYFLKEYDKIKANMSTWLDLYPTNRYILAFATRLFAHAGTESELRRVSKALYDADSQDAYDYGFYTYYHGVSAAIQGAPEMALDLLEKAYQQGHRFQDIYYDNDVDLMPLFQHQRFKQIMHPMTR